jgi:hypothetical protein
VAVVRANKINGVAPGSREAASLAESADLAVAASEPEKALHAISLAAEPPSSPLLDTLVRTRNDVVDVLEMSHIELIDPTEIRRTTCLAVGFNTVFLFAAILLLPVTLSGTEWIFTRAGFANWCVVTFIWVWHSMVIYGVSPIVES